MLERISRLRWKKIASINAFLLPGPWTSRNGRQAIPLPVTLGFQTPPGARLHSFVDRGGGWETLNLDHLPAQIDGPGWWGDPELVVSQTPEFILGRAWRKIRMQDWRPVPAARHAALPPPPPLRERPLVSILIPTDGRVVRGFRGELDLIANCYRSIVSKSTYSNLEILIAHNGRISPGIPSFRYESPGPFRLSRKINALIDRAKGDYMLILNDDTEVIEPDWIESMLRFAVLPEVGAVGARLHYPDGRIQHGGIAFGKSTLCGHVYVGHPYDCPGAARIRECSAVTGACMMFRREGRMDERYAAAFDVDFCVQQRSLGRKVVYAPGARLFHFESASIDLGERTVFPDKVRLRQQWPTCVPDPFFTNPPACCSPDE